MNAVKTVRNHWKKTTAAALLACYGIYYAKGKHKENLIRRYYCEQAEVFGQKLVSPQTKLRNITVILNPAANGRKAKEMYEKNAEPLLQLSGCDITLIKTEKVGQATQIMEVIENTDAVLVAGGDGTLLEAITGLLRREDRDEIAEKIPIGVIPLGQHNTLATKVFPHLSKDMLKGCCDAVMAAIDGHTSTSHAVEIKNVDGQSVYMLCLLNWGTLRDAWVNRSKYWYFGPLKKWLTYVFTSQKLSELTVEGKLRYLTSCSGCSKCRKKEAAGEEELEKDNGNQQQVTWMQRILGFSTKPKAVTTVKTDGKLAEARQASEESRNDLQVENVSCGEWRDVAISTVDFSCLAPNILGTKGEEMEIRVGPSTVSRTEFIQEGWKRRTDSPDTDRNKLLARCSEFSLQIEGLPKSGGGGAEDEDGESTAKPAMYYVDNEEYEVRSFHAKLIPHAFLLFTPKA